MEAAVQETQVSELCIMDKSGDTRMQWNPDDPAQVGKARSHFNELKKKGYSAYTVNKKGDKGTVIHDFDPSAERIIMTLPMIGG